MSSVIKVNYSGKTKRLTYPESTILEFLKVLREEFKISPAATLILCEDEEELSTNCTLRDLGVAPGTKLTLKVTYEENEYDVKVQTITGEMFQFKFHSSSILEDLYKAIEEKNDVTKFYPILFNHRMHIFKTKRILAEPLIHFLNLTKFDNENIPHFYLFMCDRKFENRTYEYVKNLRELLMKNELWLPMSGEQKNQALMIYLNSMYALLLAFSAKKEVDFDCVHDVYFPQFLTVLRRYLFPPACLAFKHAMEGALFNFERALLSDAFFHMFRKLLPDTIPDDELFMYTPYVFSWIFANADHTSRENTCYENVEFINRSSNSSANASEAQKYFINPVKLLNDKMVKGASDRFILKEYEEAKNCSMLGENDFQRQPDLTGLLMRIRTMYKEQKGNESMEDDIFGMYSSEYTIWFPSKDLDLFPIGNVSEQGAYTEKWNESKMDEIKEGLSKNDLYSILTFADPTALSKHSHAQLVLLKSDTIVYVISQEKQQAAQFLCFDPQSQYTHFHTDDVAELAALQALRGVVIRENTCDRRKIEQITCIVFDISGSMHMEVGLGGNKTNLLDLSLLAFNAWRDRLVSYRLPHAIGLIYFGADEESETNLEKYFQRSSNRFFRLFRAQDARIINRCPITRDFCDFEKALEDRPECGFDTPLYDAIKMAIENIASFQSKQQSRLTTTCKNLILCLTDGADNCSKTSADEVLKDLLAHNIVFDAISFDSVENRSLIKFCEETKGYYYIDVPHSKESMLNLFELEAAISLQDRNESIHGKIKSPQRQQPNDLSKPAISSKQAKLSDAIFSSTSRRRIMYEINYLNKKDSKVFELFISKDNISFWKVIMHGETGTSYSDGRWLLFIQFPPTYPEQPPEIRFVTKIYHCNINDDGKICHDVLTTAWSQKTSMYNVLMEILRLLREPNADDALSAMKGSQYKASKDDYEKAVVEWKNRYALATVDQLKQQYALE